MTFDNMPGRTHPDFRFWVRFYAKHYGWRYRWGRVSVYESHFYISNDLFIEMMAGKWRYNVND